MFLDLLSVFPARLCLAVKGLSNRRRPAAVTEKQNFHFEFATLGSDLQKVTGTDFTRGLDGLLTAFDSSEFARSRSHAAGLEEPGSPQPFVDPNPVHQ